MHTPQVVLSINHNKGSFRNNYRKGSGVSRPDIGDLDEFVKSSMHAPLLECKNV